MPEYVSNSHRSKEEAAKKKIEPVVKGKVVKKANNKRKLADTFISEDINNVKSYIVMDILIPAVKKAVSDIVTNGIDMMLYGETGRSNKDRERRRTNVDYVSYSRYSDRDDRRSSRSSIGYTYDDIIIDSRREAEDVLDKLYDLLDQYGVVSVADYYDLVGVSGEYTDNNYGWTHLRNSEVIRDRDGYVIKLPKATSIK